MMQVAKSLLFRPYNRQEKIMAVLFALLFFAILFGGAWHGHRYFIDYSMYERAGSKVLSGEISDLHELNRKETPKFHYSYFFAFLFSALTWIGPGMGTWVFAFLIGVSFAIGLFLVFFLTEGARQSLSRPYLILFLTTLLSLYSLNDNFMTSNVAVFLLVLCVLAFCLRNRFPCFAGLCLGAAVVIKLYPLTILGFFLWEKRLRVFLWTVLWAFVFYWALPAVMVGPKMATYLVETQILVLNRFGDHWPMDCIWFQCIPATVLRYAKFLGVSSSWLLRGSFFLASFGVVLFYLPSFLKRQRTMSPDFSVRMFFLILAVTCLLLPVCWYNVGIFYLPAIFYLLTRGVEDRSRVALLGVSAFGVLYGLTTPDILGTPLNDKLEALSVPFWGAVWLTLALAIDTIKKYPDQFSWSDR